MRNLFILFVLLARVASAQVVVDAITSSGAVTSNTKTFSHTSGSQATMVVTCALWGTDQVVTAMTYNAVSMSQAASPAVANNGDVTLEAWKLSAPAAGAHNVVVTLNDSNEFLCLAWTFTGHDTTTPIGVCVGDGYTSSAGSHAHDTTSGTDGFVLDMFGANQAIGTLTANAGQTSRLVQTDVGSFLRVMATSKAGATTVNTGYDWGSANFARWAHMTCPVRPASASSFIGGLLSKGVGQ